MRLISKSEWFIIDAFWLLFNFLGFAPLSIIFVRCASNKWQHWLLDFAEAIDCCLCRPSMRPFVHASACAVFLFCSAVLSRWQTPVLRNGKSRQAAEARMQRARLKNGFHNVPKLTVDKLCQASRFCSHLVRLNASARVHTKINSRRLAITKAVDVMSNVAI